MWGRRLLAVAVCVNLSAWGVKGSADGAESRSSRRSEIATPISASGLDSALKDLKTSGQLEISIASLSMGEVDIYDDLLEHRAELGATLGAFFGYPSLRAVAVRPKRQPVCDAVFSPSGNAHNFAIEYTAQGETQDVRLGQGLTAAIQRVMDARSARLQVVTSCIASLTWVDGQSEAEYEGVVDDPELSHTGSGQWTMTGETCFELFAVILGIAVLALVGITVMQALFEAMRAVAGAVLSEAPHKVWPTAQEARDHVAKLQTVPTSVKNVEDQASGLCLERGYSIGSLVTQVPTSNRSWTYDSFERDDSACHSPGYL